MGHARIARIEGQDHQGVDAQAIRAAVLEEARVGPFPADAHRYRPLPASAASPTTGQPRTLRRRRRRRGGVIREDDETVEARDQSGAGTRPSPTRASASPKASARPVLSSFTFPLAPNLSLVTTVTATRSASQTCRAPSGSQASDVVTLDPQSEVGSLPGVSMARGKVAPNAAEQSQSRARVPASDVYGAWPDGSVFCSDCQLVEREGPAATRSRLGRHGEGQRQARCTGRPDGCLHHRRKLPKTGARDNGRDFDHHRVDEHDFRPPAGPSSGPGPTTSAYRRRRGRAGEDPGEPIDRDLVTGAFVLACARHADQRRASGEDFIVAKICTGWRCPSASPRRSWPLRPGAR